METTDIDYWIRQCPVGWEKLIREIDTCIRLEDPDYKILQVKEKFGGLRYYFLGGTTATQNWVWSKADESARICQHCGKPGEMHTTDTGWWKTLCPECGKGMRLLPPDSDED